METASSLGKKGKIVPLLWLLPGALKEVCRSTDGSEWHPHREVTRDYVVACTLEKRSEGSP
jgi:hypothetical protein